MYRCQDGSILSSSTASRRGAGLSRKRVTSLAHAIVVGYYAADQSPFGEAMVDLLFLRSGFLCRSVTISGGGGYRNLSYWVPSPATKDLKSGRLFDLAKWDSFDPELLDGDRVLVGFIDDDPASPVVICPTPSKQAIRQLRSTTNAAPIPDGTHPALPDGDVRYLEHQGTRVLIDRLGNVVVDTTEAPVSNADNALSSGTSPAGRISLNVGSDADVEVRVAGTRRLRLRDAELEIEVDTVTVKAGTMKFGDPVTPLDGVVTGACNCAYSGAPHPAFSTKVMAKK